MLHSLGEGEGSKEQLLDDYFSSFKIATYAKKTEEIEEVVPEEPEKVGQLEYPDRGPEVLHVPGHLSL